MTNNYTNKSIVEALLGWEISTTSRPNTIQLNFMLELADGAINGELRRPTNLEDPNKAFMPIATALVMTMVNNIFMFAEPEDYAFVKPELSEADIRTIHLAYSNWASMSWEIGD